MGLLTEIMPGTGLEELDNPVPPSPRGPEQASCSSSASCSETWVVFVTCEATSPQYFTPDAWGRVLGVYDGSGNTLTESAIGNRILWQGREYSWKTGLYYFRARWYDPITGRWLSNDPIGISGGLNQYCFCGDNPVNFTDPLGLATVPLTGKQQQAVQWAIDSIRNRGYPEVASGIAEALADGRIVVDSNPGGFRGSVGYFSRTIKLRCEDIEETPAFGFLLTHEYAHVMMNRNVASQTFVAALSIAAKIKEGVYAAFTGEKYSESGTLLEVTASLQAAKVFPEGANFPVERH